MEYHIIKKGINSVLADNLLFKLKLFLADLAFEYPFFTEWLEKVFKELTLTDSRLILLCCDNGIFDIKGVSILKKTSDEKKICTLRVVKSYRNQGIGSCLLQKSVELLEENKPLITVSGIHMKEYKDKKPVIVIGNEAGSFLGEYQAGGLIIVLGLRSEHPFPAGRFCGTGMHGGKMFLRATELPSDLPKQIKATKARKADLAEAEEYIGEYCRLFGTDKAKIMDSKFFILTPDSANPYTRLYTPN